MNKKIAQVLMNVGRLEGVSTVHQDEVVFEAGYLDNYLLVGYLGQLLERGELEIHINNPERLDFLYQLLKFNNEDVEQTKSDYLTVAELAQLLKVSTQTIYNMLRDGRLSGVKIGREWRFTRDNADLGLHIGLNKEYNTQTKKCTREGDS